MVITRPNARQKKILVVDDDEDDFFITCDFIKDIPGQSYVIDWCSTFDEALDKIARQEYDLYLIDFRLGVKTGLDLIREAAALRCDEPLILLTGKGNRKIDMEAMQVGATDYLVKTDLSTEKLERCIRYGLERSDTLKALKHNERKYRNIFERSKDAVFITNAQFRLIDVNDAMRMLLGLPDEQLLGNRVADLLTEERDRAYLDHQLLHAGQINDWETFFQGPGGTRLSCILSASLEQDESEGIYLQGIIHDITDLKKAEKITLQAEKLAAAGRLVRTLAHEVRNPLNNINLSTEQIRQDLRDGDQKFYLDIIRRNSHRIEALISELLSTSRPTEIVLSTSSLRDILEQALGMAADRIKLKRIVLRAQYPRSNPHILADAEKLKIALLNIIINAVEAMEENQGELNVALTDQPTHHVITIRDNGCGISQEHMSRLFEPYFTSKRNGMGLGLAFTLNIVQAHKGTIDVRSEEQAGTLFTLTFPTSHPGK